MVKTIIPPALILANIVMFTLAHTLTPSSLLFPPLLPKNDGKSNEFKEIVSVSMLG
jgi:hypothetical protein